MIRNSRELCIELEVSHLTLRHFGVTRQKFHDLFVATATDISMY